MATVGGKQRSIVLDFLCHSSYTNTARAFSRECTVRNVDVDADGDEIMSWHGRDDSASGEDAELMLSEEALKQIELRKGESHVLDTWRFCSQYPSPDVRYQKFATRFCPGELMKRWISSIPISQPS